MAEVETLCGAGYGEVSPERVNSRDGYRPRSGTPGPGRSGRLAAGVFGIGRLDVICCPVGIQPDGVPGACRASHPGPRPAARYGFTQVLRSSWTGPRAAGHQNQRVAGVKVSSGMFRHACRN